MIKINMDPMNPKSSSVEVVGNPNQVIRELISIVDILSDFLWKDPKDKEQFLDDLPKLVRDAREHRTTVQIGGRHED